MLRNLRLASGFNQKALAQALGITRPAYSCYESGKALPDLKKLRILAEIFAISPENFFYPERYADLSATRRRPPKRVQLNPKLSVS